MTEIILGSIILLLLITNVVQLVLNAKERERIIVNAQKEREHLTKAVIAKNIYELDSSIKGEDMKEEVLKEPDFIPTENADEKTFMKHIEKVLQKEEEPEVEE